LPLRKNKDKKFASGLRMTRGFFIGKRKESDPGDGKREFFGSGHDRNISALISGLRVEMGSFFQMVIKKIPETDFLF